MSNNTQNYMNDILQGIPYALIVTNSQEVILDINKAAEKLLTCDPQEFIGKEIKDLLPELQGTTSPALNNVQSDLEITITSRNTNDLFLKHSVGVFRFDTEHRYVHALWDISTQVQTEIALKETNERIRAILETIPNALITTDHGGKIETFNLASEPLFQYTAEEVIGRQIGTLLPALDKNLNVIPNTGQKLYARRKNTSEFPAELSVGEMNLAGKQLLAYVVRDISDRVRAEQEAHDAREQLIESEKLASLGELVAGVAHEINTPVGISVTSASHLREQYQALSEEYATGALKRPTLESFLSACDEATRILDTNLRRASELIQSFKQIAVDQSSSEQRYFNVREYLDELLLSLRPKLKRTRHKITIICASDLYINSYPGALSQILTNLIMNSLIHGLSTVSEGNIEIRMRILDPDIELVYSDDGSGIPHDKKKRIFDPFFTTQRGHGSSGLGLHIVYNLVKQTLGGNIHCDTEQGKGTSFVIRFPISRDESTNE